MDVAGRCAIVTGASSGIGYAIAHALASAGAKVAMLARTKDRLEAAAARCGNGAVPLVCDVSRNSAVEAVVSRVSEVFGSAPDILVNNAGLFLLGYLQDMTPATFGEVVSVNLISPFLLVRAFLPAMLARESGHIVTIGSEADHRVFKENGAYAASKWGTRALHEVMLLELRGRGVKSTLVSPGPVDTPLWDDVDPDNKKGFLPRASMLRPEAVAQAVLYSISQPDTVNVDEVRLSPG